MIILGIESSCDETAAAILKDGELLSNVVVSQIDIFKAYGGVIPEVAARSHLEAILPVIDKAIADAHVTWDDITHIAVTHTPGLLGSLLIGTLTARTLAILHNKPLYAVHHLKSHIYSNWLSDQTPEFPLLALVISGGHTQIIYMPRHNDFQIIGTTLDDAVGECFDKIAKILGLPYPGGPSIAKAAQKGNPTKYRFPHPQVDGLNFSFSGLKTAVLRTVQKECDVGLDYPSHDLKNLLTTEQIADFAASFQKTAIDILLEKLNLALLEYRDIKSIVFAGGVSANKELRGAASRRGERCSSSGSFPPARAATYIPDGTEKVAKNEQSFPDSQSMTSRTESGDPDKSARPQALEAKPKIFFPSPEFSGDNAAMVAMAAYWEIKSGVSPTDPYKLTLAPRSLLC
ncbi:tRNA (adenosine(37)-N6)-threonylcarbamoyltransferase complex transferase subunit TsaD [Candidatus Saccharibacteria bacterium]|nr:tRNA (adenosine(37)-N6)-threonylcarbamoyltransferase complex transferase subunit TsaD [Candidatus Saccharibacteria bacterium]MBR6123007.1 tRNA (adenosine(37)-N6)-threonylcarbamoyltransferase complex transferase subunit TsaD [Candidatus Saccharibacteria bacterium]